MEENRERWEQGGKKGSEEMEKNNKEHQELLKKSKRVKI